MNQQSVDTGDSIDNVPLLETKNATVFQQDQRVFHESNLRIDQDEHVAILGPNGSGKSTLLKLLTRELYPVVADNSYIKIFGNDRINLWELRQRIGIVSHQLQENYHPIATGLDVVLSAFFGAIGIHQHHKVQDEQHQYAQHLMQEFDIAHLQDRWFIQMSTGQQRRFLLARAIAHQPQTLILDEPTEGLDLHATQYYLNTLNTIVAKGCQIVLVTHHIHEIIPAIERIIFLNQGQIQGDGHKTVMLTDAHLSALYGIDLHVVGRQGYYQALFGA